MSGHHGLAMTMAVFLFHLKLVHGDGPLLATSTAAPSTAAPSTAAPSTDLQVVQVESKNVPGKFLWAESTEEGSSVQVTEIKDEWRLHPGNSPGSYYLECVRAGKYLTHTGNSPIPTVISSEKSAESLWYLHGQADGSVALQQASPSSEDFKWLHFNANPPYPRSVTVYWLNAGGYFNFLTSDGQPITLVPSTAAPSTAAPSTAAPSTDLQVVQVESKNIPGKFLWAESTEEGSSVQLTEIKDEWRLHPGPSPKSYYLECVRAGKYLTHTGMWAIATFISSEKSAESLWYLHDQADGSVALEQAYPHSEDFTWLHYNTGPTCPKLVQVFRLNAGGYFNFLISDGQPIPLAPAPCAAPSMAAPSTELQVVQVESKNVPGKFLRAESTEEGSSVQVSEIKDEWRLHPGPSPKSYYLECVRAGKYLTHTRGAIPYQLSFPATHQIKAFGIYMVKRMAV